MRWFYLPLTFVLIVLAPSNGLSAEANGLADLQTVNVVIDDLDSGASKLGLNEKLLADHTLALLRSKVPQLIVNKSSAEGTLLVDVTVETIKEDGKTVRYYGVIEVEVFRLVTVQKTGQSILPPVWDGQYILTGEVGKAVEQVKDALGLILSDFASKWLEVNP